MNLSFLYRAVLSVLIVGALYTLMEAAKPKARGSYAMPEGLGEQEFNSALKEYKFTDHHNIEAVKRQARERINQLEQEVERTKKDMDFLDETIKKESTPSERGLQDAKRLQAQRYKQRGNLFDAYNDKIDQMEDLIAVLNSADTIALTRQERMVENARVALAKEIDRFVKDKQIAPVFDDFMKSRDPNYSLNEFAPEELYGLIEQFDKRLYNSMADLELGPLKQRARLITYVRNAYGRLKPYFADFDRTVKELEAVKNDLNKKEREVKMGGNEEPFGTIGEFVSVDKPIKEEVVTVVKPQVSPISDRINNLIGDFESGIRGGVPIQDYENTPVYKELVAGKENALEGLKGLELEKMGIRSGSYVELKGLLNRLASDPIAATDLKLQTLYNRGYRYLLLVFTELLKNNELALQKVAENERAELESYQNALNREKVLLQAINKQYLSTISRGF